MKKEWTHKLLYTRNDGTTDHATLEVRREGKYYSSYLKMGTIRKRIFSGLVNPDDAYHCTVRALDLYREHAVI